MIPTNYLEKVYAGFLGMNIGIRLGAPVEPTIWTYERIKNTYGDIRAYVKDYIHFAADDDANGPYYFLRALKDDAVNREPCPQDVGRAWLNYAREGVGMFWWGGYGRSTEHTAYLNLKAGVPAPHSGSIAQNGKTIAEQIGGQIFIDTWGLISPCDPAAAARRAAVSASVSHDGEGLEGARFIAACIALAFGMDDIEWIVREALKQVGPESTYRRVAEAVIAFHKSHPEDFRACRKMLEDDFGYDKYPGVCHIIPNAGVCVLAMLYGEGDFARTVEIAAMCGWDTDCNAGNVGTVLGVMVGIDQIPDRYRKPINDLLVLSGITGSLNILDIPSYAKELALLGYRMSGEEAPADLRESFHEEETYFDFELPGSTHGFHVSNSFTTSISHTDERAYRGHGALSVLIDRVGRFEGGRVYYKPFYRRADFSDERYSPVFSPRAYAGQQVSFQLFLDQWEGGHPVLVAPYVRLSMSGTILDLGYRPLTFGQWQEISFTIPDTQGEPVDEVGFLYEGNCKEKTLGRILLDEFRIYGKADYRVALAKQKVEFGCLTPFSQNLGAWTLENGRLHALSCETAQCFTGHYFTRDVTLTAPVQPEHGTGHTLSVRAQGAMRGYYAGFGEPGKAVIYKQDFGLSVLAECDFDWQCGKEYQLTLTAQGDMITLSVDGKALLSAHDAAFAYGMVGFVRVGMGRTLYGDLRVRELESGEKKEGRTP